MPQLSAAHHRRLAQRRERWHDAFASAIVLVVAVLVFWLVPAPDTAHAHQRAHAEPGAAHQAGVPPCRTFTRGPAMTTARPTPVTPRQPPSAPVAGSAGAADEGLLT
jgi:hypothetical protein